MLSAILTALVGSVLNVAGKVFLAWLNKREDNATTAAQIAHIAKAAQIVAAKVPASAAADALDTGKV